MNEITLLRNAFKGFVGMGEESFGLSEQYWQVRDYKKGEFYNDFQQVCKYLGFVVDGVFRTYYLDEETGNEKYFFLYKQPNCGFLCQFYQPNSLSFLHPIYG